MPGQIRKAPRQRRDIHTLGKPQTHHQRFGHRVAGGFLNQGLDAMTHGLDLFEPGSRTAPCGKPAPAMIHVHPAMRARSDPDPVAGPPVGQIVAAFLARPGVIGDFIGRHAGLRHDPVCFKEQVGGVIILHRQGLAAPRAGEEHGAGLDGQLIDRHMGDAKIERLMKFVPPALQALVLSGVDQVDRKPVKMCLCLTQCAGGLVGGMLAPEKGKTIIAKRLHPE